MNRLKKIYRYYNWGGRFLNDSFNKDVKKLNELEFQKKPLRSDVINFLLSTYNRETKYLEIGVRNPNDNFNKILSSVKYSVDPGLEFKENPVDFKLTSDEFFEQLRNNSILNANIKFEIIFIDGLHLAEQVYNDIHNALDFIADDGYIVLHDCNPPSEWHAREEHKYVISPAGENWNGTTWKAFVKWREEMPKNSCCIDTDWGVGIISKNINFGEPIKINNPFFEFNIFNKNRAQFLNLLDFNSFKKVILKNLNK